MNQIGPERQFKFHRASCGAQVRSSDFDIGAQHFSGDEELVLINSEALVNIWFTHEQQRLISGRVSVKTKVGFLTNEIADHHEWLRSMNGYSPRFL